MTSALSQSPAPNLAQATGDIGTVGVEAAPQAGMAIVGNRSRRRRAGQCIAPRRIARGIINDNVRQGINNPPRRRDKMAPTR